LEGTERTIQKLALGVARLSAAADSGFAFGTWNHRIIAEPDGRYYELPQNADTIGVVYAFRDPFFYRDPANGREYVLFTANAAGRDTASGLNRSFNSVVGIVEARSTALRSWKILPPLFTGFGVNRQMERPHIINTNGLYYVFWLSHSFTFSAAFTGYEGLYGYAGESLFGQKEPLNGSSLVVGNPPVVAAQSYSFVALPAGEGSAKVISFLNVVGDKPYVTFAPAVGLTLDGLNTRIVSANAGPRFSLQGVDTKSAAVRSVAPSAQR
jgi:levansucrase